jgi:hypothetical protein
MMFWVVMLCKLVGRYQLFGETWFSIFRIEGVFGYKLSTSQHPYLSPNNGYSIFLWHCGIYLWVDTALQTKRTASTHVMVISGLIIFSEYCYVDLTIKDNRTLHFKIGPRMLLVITKEPLSSMKFYSALFIEVLTFIFINLHVQF